MNRCKLMSASKASNTISNCAALMHSFLICAFVAVNVGIFAADSGANKKSSTSVDIQPNDGRKLFGFNTSQLAFTYGKRGFAYLSDQLDMFGRYGANVVRVMGEPIYVTGGTYSQTQ